jgi:hypothetical protein
MEKVVGHGHGDGIAKLWKEVGNPYNGKRGNPTRCHPQITHTASDEAKG